MITLPFKAKSEKQAIIFIGIQASGKSTFFNEILACQGYTHINLDTLHTLNKERIAIQNCFENGTSFAVDNTNIERANRERYIPSAKEHGYEVIGIFFQSILKDCIERNEKRERQVPRHAIACTQNKLQMPDLTEGFDKLYFAKITDNGFEITDWKE